MELKFARQLARYLMDQHGLTSWGFEFDQAKRRFGVCRKRTKEIQLSAVLTQLNTEERVRNTVLHEIAHALCGERGHGLDWKRACVEIGAKPERCYSHAVVTPTVKRVINWQGVCPVCSYVLYRNRTPHQGCWHSGCGG